MVDGISSSTPAPVNSEPDTASFHPQSDRPASADFSPESSRGHTSSRNRPPHLARGKTANSRPQDVKLGRGPSDAATPSGNNRSSRRRSQAPPGDDLTSILTFSLSTPPFPECMICFNPIRPEQPSWSCSPREERDVHSCWNTFHLKCIQPWAEKSVKDIEEAWRARGEEKKGEWRCPGCQSKREVVPRKYWCFCGFTQDPKPPRLATPHSCGNSCSRARVCGHPCLLPCHPGPCPPCMITIQNPCHCGKDVVALVCSRTNSTTTGGVSLPSSRSCGHECGKSLSCRNHICKSTCHDGECPPCPVSDLVRCWCGKERKKLACGEGEAKECNILSADGEESWIGKFDCGNVCERPFDCGTHKCSKTCHPPSPVAPECPYSPVVVTHCPCGKHSLSDSASSRYFTKGAKIVRSACTDPIPTCMSPCGKLLGGCPCPPCVVPLVRPCRCGTTTRSLTCSAAQSETESTTFLCNKPCGALRACGHHQCTRLCCPLANLANPSGKGKKKASGNTTNADVVDVSGWHICDVVCGKLLSCGNHRCEERDHRGSCPPCFQSSFEEITCHCERSVLEPPVPCGMRVECSYPCVRPAPSCGHPKGTHLCHGDATSCPPCVYLTEKPCACGKMVIGNVRCSQEKVSCGKPCGRPLGCGFHLCEQLCHAGACFSCTAICGKPRKLCLPTQHPCTQPCHAPSVCPEVEPCSAVITVLCACGRIQQAVLCGRSASNSAGREATLAPRCTNECEIGKRNARLAEALGINPDLHKVNRQVAYSDELLAFARLNGKFVELVEKAFSEFVTSDKKVQVLPHMPEAKRKFLSTVYRMDTQMVDREPHRSVQLIRRIDTRIPANPLSQVFSTLGKLTDLRASPRPVLAPNSSSGLPRVSRGWNSVLAPSPARTPPPPAQSINNLSARTTPVGSNHASRSSTPLQSLSVAPITATAPSSEAVPDSWEDDV
ncbi:hypothetical protein B0F90DRAFT_1809057 [Multifurca ochricompacta]|uniref:NF-X1-type domain-containing protein n=1 Tax=Multifurca ochricompacta TaxID=376703 RepID=A0AAD4QQE1_9AGAM|nr:hypothetical protein B0F90DRAFT_1809057 [Multifurca ochricompacta]